ncbi:AMP-binding protein [uncultured Sulfurimonas sp.]|jgi:long-chain acyl-CoA synthetase|uniref:AMP-binding protein n=1 Tax=uncultured Sulfurimonas sp. TaxID=291845 RepID=UPI0032B227D1
MNYPYENLENFTLNNLLNRSIELYNSQAVLSKLEEEPMTYKSLGENVSTMVALLQSHGITKGDKVALLSENSPNWAVAYFSVTYFGAVIVPILPDFHTSDVHHIIRHSEAKAIFVSQKHQATIEEFENSALCLAIKLDDLTIINELTNHSYLKKIKQKIHTKKEQTIPSEDDIAAILYTSGTTGNSKGVMLSHKNLVTNTLSTHSKIKILPSDVFLSILPLAHTLECTVGLLVPILHGSSVVYIDKVPTPSVLLKAFSIVKPTMMVSVPLIIEKIYKNKILPKFTGSFLMRNLYKIPFIRKQLNKIAGKQLIETFGGRLRFFGIGGAGVSPFVESFLKEANFPYIIGYGLTETAPLLAGSILGETIKLKSTGTAFPYVNMEIRDKNPETGEGEIVIQSPSLMLGYYKDEKQTAEVIKDGWFLTGDLGYIDEDGFLFISGRSKNVIIGKGGENIFPEQIEAIINQHEAILDSLVMMRDERLITKVHFDYALIDKMLDAHKHTDEEIKKEITQLLEEIRIDVNTKVASYSKMVKFIEQVEPFVKTPTKKIKRFLYVE